MILKQLSDMVREQDETINSWLSAKRTEAAPHITSSVDLRHNELRLVPVDVNIYPAGFQNLSELARERAAFHFKTGLQANQADAHKVLIVPENHTRNLPYLDNLAAIKSILELAGFQAEIGSLVAEEKTGFDLERADGSRLHQQALEQKNGQLQTKLGFVPDIILMNNDGTSGIPELLKHISQPVVPSLAYGWFQRKKSCHFKAYEKLAQDFCATTGLDSWRISAYFACARHVDFKERTGVDELAVKVDALIERIKAKHVEYGIAEDPYVYVKADSGTYGMGIMQVRDGSELLEMNKKQRNKMHVIKEGAEVHDVIIQEGIRTVDTVEGKAAEPMVYLVDGVPVGGMFRVNANRDALGNLNAAGMEYVGMCEEGEQGTHVHQVAGCDFAAYGIIGALSALAAGRESYGDAAAMSEQKCA